MLSFDELVAIMKKLQAPGGCPWDREQTHESLKPYLIEEAYEVIEAIDTGSDTHMREELGDLLLQVVFHAEIADREGRFTMDDVIRGIIEKLKRRHPHVFGDTHVENSGQVIKNWEEIKRREKREKKTDSHNGNGLNRNTGKGISLCIPGLRNLTTRVRSYGIEAETISPIQEAMHKKIIADYTSGDRLSHDFLSIFRSCA